jgi:nucleotide-binding universal stress UspA family protein
MSWNPIVVGVDPSPEGVWAGAGAEQLARQAGTTCRLICAVPEPWLGGPDMPVAAGDLRMLRGQIEMQTREQIRELLRRSVPAPAADQIEVRFGRPAQVLHETAQEADADLIVVGAKRHRPLSRWIVGSTAHDLVRVARTPVLVATPSVARIERVLVAVDLSAAAAGAIAAGERMAALSGAAVRFVHVVAPLPLVPAIPDDVGSGEYARLTEDVLERSIWPTISMPAADRVVRHGPVSQSLVQEVASWSADLLVVGSHGRGLIDRVLLGSVTRDLLGSIPTSLLVVPPVAAARLATADWGAVPANWVI